MLDHTNHQELDSRTISDNRYRRRLDLLKWFYSIDIRASRACSLGSMNPVES